MSQPPIVRAYVTRVLNKVSWVFLAIAQAGLVVKFSVDIASYVRHRLDTRYEICFRCVSEDMLEWLAGPAYFLAVLLVIVGGLLARSRVGWSLPDQRPLREYAGKLAAAVVLAVGLTLPVLAGLAGVLWIVLDDRIVAGQGLEILAVMGWGLGICVVGALIGLTLTLMFRYWAIVAGVVLFMAFAEVITVEDGYGNPTMNWAGPWLPLVNYQALVEHGTTYQTYDPGNGPRSAGWAELSFSHGLTYFTWLIVGVVLLGAVSSVGRWLLLRWTAARRGPVAESLSE